MAPRRPGMEALTPLPWYSWLLIAAACLTLMVLALFGVTKWLLRREPYGRFLRIRARAKIGFFRALLKEPRIPLGVKTIPLVLVVYLAIPFDIIPDFIPVIGYLDDVGALLLTLALVLAFSPRPVILSLLKDAESSAANQQAPAKKGAKENHAE